MDLSIILVNWNSMAFLRECVRSLRATITGLEYEILVVENESERDDSREALRRGELEGVRVLWPGANLGFVRANNLGAREARGRVLLFLNPDTVVLEDAVAKMVRELEARPDAGVVGCRLLNGDGSLQTSCVQAFPTLANQFLGVEALRLRFPRWKMWGIGMLFETPAVYEAEVVSGACLMIRREVFEQAGGFSSDYFMYAEEVDLCHAAGRNGWKVYHVGTARVIHYGGQSTGQEQSTSSGSAFSDVLMRDSVHTFLRKTRGAVYALGYRTGMLVSAGARMLALAAPAAAGSRGARRALRKWTHIAQWSVGLENWTKTLAAQADQRMAGIQ